MFTDFTPSASLQIIDCMNVFTAWRALISSINLLSVAAVQQVSNCEKWNRFLFFWLQKKLLCVFCWLLSRSEPKPDSWQAAKLMSAPNKCWLQLYCDLSSSAASDSLPQNSPVLLPKPHFWQLLCSNTRPPTTPSVCVRACCILTERMNLCGDSFNRRSNKVLFYSLLLLFVVLSSCEVCR